MPSAPRKPTKRTTPTPKKRSASSKKPSVAKVHKTLNAPKWIDPEKPFKWRDPNKKTSTEAEQRKAVDHICACLAQGSIELQLVLYNLVPRLLRETLHDWRHKTPEFNAAIDDAWEVGCARDQMRILRIADGIQPPLEMGHTTFKQRKAYRAEVKRDSLRINAMQKRLEALNRRYRNKQILEGDAQNPLMPSTFVMQPVQARVLDDEALEHDAEE